MTLAKNCFIFLGAFLSGCASVVSSVTGGLAEDLSSVILNSEDVEVVRAGAPAYLIMLDALLNSDPDNTALLISAASLNAAYATAFVDDRVRRQAFAVKSFELSSRAACLKIEWTCSARTVDLKQLELSLADLEASDVPLTYAFGSAWAGWVQAHSEDWAAIAELGRIKAIMTRLVAINEKYDNGGPRLYLGVFETLLPPALGGRPEVGRRHFERAIEISEGRHLFVRVLFAEQYGRLVFDRALHDRELNAVLEASPIMEGLTLINLLAQEQARELLETGNDYF